MTDDGQSQPHRPARREPMLWLVFGLPALAVYRGEEVVMKEMPLPHPRLTWTDRDFWAGYAMDLPRRFPGAPRLADDLTAA